MADVKVGVDLEYGSRGLDKAMADVDRLERRVTGAAARGTKSANRMGGAIMLANRFAVPAAAAYGVGKGIQRSVSSALSFESAMADVNKVLGDMPADKLADIETGILQMSGRLPMAAKDIASIVAAGGQANIPTDELLKFTEQSVKMGVAFGISAGEAGGAMAGLRTIFDRDTDGVTQLGDAINHLSNNANATASDMLNILNRSGSVADQFGLTAEQTAALGGTFLALKTPPQVAATGINAMLNKLATADRQSRKFQAGLEAIGMSASGLKTAIAQDAQGTLVQFLSALEGVEDRQGVLSDMFGLEYSDDLAKLVGGLDEYKRQLGLLAEPDLSGSMEAEYQTRANTTENNLQLFANNIQRAAIAIGDVLLPQIDAALTAFNDWASSIESLSDLLKSLEGMIGESPLGEGAVEIIHDIGRFVTSAVDMVSNVMSYVGGTLDGIAKGLGFEDAGDALEQAVSLVAKITGWIADLMGQGAEATENDPAAVSARWEARTRAVVKFFDDTGKLIGDVIAAIEKFIDDTIAFVESISGAVSASWETGTRVVVKFFDDTSKAIGDLIAAIEKFIDTIIGFVESIPQKIENAINMVEEKLSALDPRNWKIFRGDGDQQAVDQQAVTLEQVLQAQSQARMADLEGQKSSAIRQLDYLANPLGLFNEWNVGADLVQQLKAGEISLEQFRTRLQEAAAAGGRFSDVAREMDAVAARAQEAEAAINAINLTGSGQRIISSLADGMNAEIPAVHAASAQAAETVRGYFPHSPAKYGPLRSFSGRGTVAQLARTLDPTPIRGAARAMAAAIAGEKYNADGIVTGSADVDGKNPPGVFRENPQGLFRGNPPGLSHANGSSSKGITVQGGISIVVQAASDPEATARAVYGALSSEMDGLLGDAA